MKVLWVTAQIITLVAGDLNMKASGFGGWIMNMLEQLKLEHDIQLGVAIVSSKVQVIVESEHEGIKCYIAPDCGNKGISEENRNSIIEMFNPDIIHVEGNEFGIHNSFVKCGNKPVLLSLQGILSGYEPYQYGEIPISDYLFNPKSGKMISSWVLLLRKHLLFNKRIEVENDTIRCAKYISGRTFWDRAHSYWINSNAKYYSCNRILRDIFYLNHWNIKKIERYSIFVGNGYSPLKGLHFVIEAAALLKGEYPSLRVYVAGNNPIATENRKGIHKYGYSRYLLQQIKKYGLEENFVFTGSLLGDDMVKLMLKCNAYCLPSLIENSPNTLGEAMMLGMPCISAYTGGASEMATDEECLFYRANDPSILAWQAKRIFENDDFAITMGEKASCHARKTHDPLTNKNALINVYKEIFKEYYGAINEANN